VDEVEGEEEEEEKEEELEPGEENENLLSDWRKQRSIRYRFREPQPSILTVTPRHMQGSGRGID